MLTKYQTVIAGRWVDAASGEYFESDNPYTGKPWALIPARRGRRRRSRRAGGAHRRSRPGDWPKLTAVAARRAAAQARRSRSPSTSKRAGRDRSPRQRQAARRDERADRVHGAVVPLLRRPRRQDRRRGHPDRQARHLQLHALRAARRRRRDHPVELAAAADDVEAGAGARRRQHVVIKPSEFTSASVARVHEARRAGRLSAGRRQRRHRLRRRTSACRWSSIRWSPRSRSPAPTRTGQRDLRGRRARAEARHAWSSAASRRTSCSTMRISTTR